jgi:hypothetical protein
MSLYAYKLLDVIASITKSDVSILGYDISASLMFSITEDNWSI